MYVRTSPPDGELLGLADGDPDGDPDGLADGLLLGDALGLVLGELDGDELGELLGLELGELDGELDGELLGDELGELDGELDGLPPPAATAISMACATIYAPRFDQLTVVVALAASYSTSFCWSPAPPPTFVSTSSV